jgi:hypothetical protein
MRHNSRRCMHGARSFFSSLASEPFLIHVNREKYVVLPDVISDFENVDVAI